MIPTMKIRLLLLGLLTATVLTAHDKSTDDKDCDCCKDEAAAAAKKTDAPKEYPLRGIIVQVMADQGGLLVKHEDIPGLMPGMTMMFRVEAATLKAAKPGQTITGTLVQRGGEFWLGSVQAVK
jgi:Cu/Ag efflux protein CusF